MGKPSSMAPSHMSSAECEAVIPIRSFKRSYSSTIEAMSDEPIMHSTSDGCPWMEVFDVSVGFGSVKPLELHQFIGRQRLAGHQLGHEVLGLVAGSRSLTFTCTGSSHGSENVLN